MAREPRHDIGDFLGRHWSPLDLTAPAFADRSLPAGKQVFLQFVEAGSILGLTDSIWQRMQACSCWEAVP